MISKELLSRATDMLKVAGDDATRWHLCGVAIYAPAGDLVRLAATNGHVLVTRAIKAKCPQGEFFLRHDSAQVLKLILAEHKYVEEIDAAIDMNGGLFIGSDRGAKARLEKLETYPEYAQVIPTHAHPVAITLNAEYLLAVAEILKDGNKRATPHLRLVFDPLKPTSPVLLQREGLDDVTAVVMPVRDRDTSRIASEFGEFIDGVRSITDDTVISLGSVCPA